MTRILHLDSAITGENSISRQITAKIVERLRSVHSDADLVRRDLVADPIPHLTLDQLGDKSIVEEFLGADVVVVGAPMYNFTVPTQLKAWLDRIVVNGTTFRYTAEGKPEGLAGPKRVIVGLSRGGVYGPERGNADYEHTESYLKIIFNFIGITPEFARADGINLGPEAKAKALSEALAEAEKLAA